VGATPFIVNFNVLLQGVGDLEVAKRIARAVSERGGGLRSVQAMALQHTEGEIVCLRVACTLHAVEAAHGGTIAWLGLAGVGERRSG
jgi:glutamate formiminotransferase